MMENERKAEIKSYYSQELLDGVKPMNAETAEFLWNMMNGIGERRMMENELKEFEEWLNKRRNESPER